MTLFVLFGDDIKLLCAAATDGTFSILTILLYIT